jgi:sigma-B regulation protein RsbU (phosphoserine phosphatase)
LSVGGDYFDLIELGPDRASFIIADVSGKGLGAALLSSMLQGTFSALALGHEPARMFSHANQFVVDRTEVGRYATLFFGTLDALGRLQYINAGHLPPLLARSGGVELIFKADSLPLGLFPNAEFGPRFHRLDPGDTLVLYTDGITEAMDAEGNQFGIDRLQEVVMHNSKASVKALQGAILEAVDEFACGAHQADDITIFILRYMGTS